MNRKIFTLTDIKDQLDNARIALIHNLNAYDDDLEETYDNFLIELNKLELMIKKVVHGK